MTYVWTLSMFDRTQYVIERKQSATSVFLGGFAGVTFEVKDADRNLLGYFKKQERLAEGEFWIEGTDGTRLGEIRAPKMGYTIHDAQGQLQATVKEVPARKEESRRGLLAIILAVMPVAAIPAVLLLSLAVPGFSQMLETSVFIFFIIGCVGLTCFGLVLYAYLATKGRFGKPKWLIEDPEGRQLAEGNDFLLGSRLEILAPDGDEIARVKGSVISLKPSYRVNISSQDFDPLLILSYTVVMAYRHIETVRSAV